MTTLANFRPRLLWVLTLSAALTGCASMQSHDKLATSMQTAGRTGGIPAALQQLEASAKSDDDRAALLYNLERGELLRMDRRYQDSTEAFLKADTKVKEWEETAKTDPSKLMGTVGAALISERLKNYEGQDYEKVWLTTRLALNRVAVGDLENARVDIKRTHEREAIIAEFRSKETLAAEQEAKDKGAAAGGKELNGYPVETLNDPEVLALKNGYSNALSHYLAGFMYEMLNEPGLAAPGYRKAIELKPDTPALEEGLRGLDSRTSFTWKRRQRMTDVLFIVEAGDAPARKPKAFTIPVPTSRGMVTASISYPIIEPSNDPLLTTLSAAGTNLKMEKVVDVNVMARRALKDEMPGMVLRGVTRAVAKGMVQNELQKRGGLVGGLIGAVASAATEVADDRMWRMLPGRVYIARGYLPPGEHVVTVNGRALPDPVKIDGQYALVPLRLYENTVLMGEVASVGKLAPVGSVPAEAAAPAQQGKEASRASTPTRSRTAATNTKPAVKATATTPAAK
ncbi:lipoprotein [Acidovorax sp. DW039]|uniref:COG3014 family protein n=1 Tax=Acidovorax sp. DW039 TaxID=3095606 RepID=UPI003085D495|nr:lipoprotein [Acidovorax sp. DW039]